MDAFLQERPHGDQVIGSRRCCIKKSGLFRPLLLAHQMACFDARRHLLNAPNFDREQEEVPGACLPAQQARCVGGS